MSHWFQYPTQDVLHTVCIVTLLIWNTHWNTRVSCHFFYVYSRHIVLGWKNNSKYVSKTYKKMYINTSNIQVFFCVHFLRNIWNVQYFDKFLAPFGEYSPIPYTWSRWHIWNLTCKNMYYFNWCYIFAIRNNGVCIVYISHTYFGVEFMRTTCQNTHQEMLCEHFNIL